MDLVGIFSTTFLSAVLSSETGEDGELLAAGDLRTVCWVGLLYPAFSSRGGEGEEIAMLVPPVRRTAGCNFGVLPSGGG